MSVSSIEQLLVDHKAITGPRKPRSFRPSQIVDHVYIGGSNDAANYTHLYDNNIRVVVCAAAEHSQAIITGLQPPKIQAPHPSATATASTTSTLDPTPHHQGTKIPPQVKTTGDTVGLLHVPKVNRISPAPRRLDAIPCVTDLKKDLPRFITQFHAEHVAEPKSDDEKRKGSTEVAEVKAPPRDRVLLWISLPLFDNEGQRIAQHFQLASDVIRQCRKLSVGILVHCLAGRSRSASLVCAHLIDEVISLKYALPTTAEGDVDAEEGQPTKSGSDATPVQQSNTSGVEETTTTTTELTATLESEGCREESPTQPQVMMPPPKSIAERTEERKKLSASDMLAQNVVRMKRRGSATVSSSSRTNKAGPPLTVQVIDFVRTRRLCIQPNEGFHAQLLDWEKKLLAIATTPTTARNE